MAIYLLGPFRLDTEADRAELERESRLTTRAPLHGAQADMTSRSVSGGRLRPTQNPNWVTRGGRLVTSTRSSWTSWRRLELGVTVRADRKLGTSAASRFVGIYLIGAKFSPYLMISFLNFIMRFVRSASESLALYAQK